VVEEVAVEELTEEDADEGEPMEEDNPTPPKIIVIETLDTPATRRAKARLRKLEKMGEEVVTNTTQRRSSAAAGPSRHVAHDHDSDLSSLSDLSDTKEDKATISRTRRRTRGKPKRKPLERSSHPRKSMKGKKEEKESDLPRTLEGGTLVWGKAKTYPWWPAVVFEPDDPEIPPEILDGAKPDDEPVHLVQYYDKGRTWEWLVEEKILLFGEDQALDADMLANNSKRQKWKSQHTRSMCREAYREAMAEMETDRGALDLEGSQDL